MSLRSHPKMIWQGEPVWNPSSWSWMTTIGTAASASSEGIEKYGKLKSVRQFSDHKGVAAIELIVGFEKAAFSAVIRLDDAAAIADLYTVLGCLHGYSLQQIGDLELTRSPRILAKYPQLYT
jgi:hypothetical protein